MVLAYLGACRACSLIQETTQWLELQDIWEKLVGAKVLREASGRKRDHCKAAAVGELPCRELFMLSVHQVWDAPEGWRQGRCC